MKFIILPYRDSYFWNDYGTSVRDLQIAEILSRTYEVIFINRPVSIYERLLNKKKRYGSLKKYSNRISFIDSTSYDLLGPLTGRRWTKYCYTKTLKKVLEENNSLDTVFLDFSPFCDTSFIKNYKIIYWYDLIDNFNIHNRYSDKEKKEVSYKYNLVSTIADVVSGVSDNALKEITSSNKSVLSNGVYIEKNQSNKFNELSSSDGELFDFGFLGFITDKFDVDFVNQLAEKYSIIIWGHFYDDSVNSQLSKRIKIGGRFKYDDIEHIMATFKVGLMPYLKDKLHDESPLKMYEYFKYAKPCLSSVDYEIHSNYFINYTELSDSNLDDTIKLLILSSGKQAIVDQIKPSWKQDVKINDFIKKHFDK